MTLPPRQYNMENVTSKRKIIIKDSQSGELLASANTPEDVFLFEGTWYFDPEDVDLTHLVITERTYICPYKGICYWIDLDAPDYRAQDVAFTYFQVNEGYEQIKDKIGFYAGQREATVQEASQS